MHCLKQKTDLTLLFKKAAVFVDVVFFNPYPLIENDKALSIYLRCLRRAIFFRSQTPLIHN